MPLVAGLAEVFVAAFALLVAIAAYLLLKAIGSGLPNFSVLGVGINIGHWFEGLADHVANWIVNTARNEWAFLRDMFNVTAWLFDHAFNATADAISHAFDYADHIVTRIIPDAIHTAEHTAAEHAQQLVNTVETGLQAARHDLAAGLGAAERAVYERAADTISSVENNVRAAVSYGVDEAESYTDAAISDLHRTLTKAIDDAKAQVEGDLHDVKTTLTRGISTLSNTVAADYTAALGAAKQDAADALNTARGLVKDARTYAENVASADAGAVQTVLQRAIDATNSTVTNLTTTVGTDLTAAEQYAQAQVATGLQDISGVLNHTATTVTGAIGAAAAGVAAGISGVADQAQQDATQALDRADAALGQALDGIYSDLTGKALAWNGDIASVEGLLAGAITAAVAGVAARVATLERCSVGVCENSPNNFGNLLKDALGIASAAEVFALLARMVKDPAGAEQEYAADVDWAYHKGLGAFDLLLSL